MSFLTQADGTDANVVYGVNASGSGIIGHFCCVRKQNRHSQYARSQRRNDYLVNRHQRGERRRTSTDQDFTNSGTALSANWTANDGSGIDHYTYAIGTTSGAADVVSYTSTGASTNVTKSSLTLTNGATYYFTIRALDAGNDLIAQASSNGIIVDTQAAAFSSISAAANSTGATIHMDQ